MLGVIQQPLSEAFEVSEVMRVYTLPTLIIPVEFLSDSSARHDILDSALDTNCLYTDTEVIVR